MLLATALIPSGVKADDCDDSIEVLIAKEALKQGVSVDLALAVARVESGLVPTAVGKHGEIGIFQVMPYHYSYHDRKDLKTNIHIGITLLKAYSKVCSDMGDAWVICFNQGPNRRPRYPMYHPYYRKILQALR